MTSGSNPLLDPTDHSLDEDNGMVQYSLQKPRFLTEADGVVRLQPLPVEDSLLTLEFLLRLRGQAVSSLPKALQEKVRDARRQRTASAASEPQTAASSSASSPACLTLEDSLRYLDDAPAPIVGFTDNLYPRHQLRSPAFLFTLYLENVSAQNALGHLSALFSIPQKSFLTRTSANKMSCASLLCALEANRLRREHLLLVNTMRHPGFVIRVSGIREITTWEAAPTIDREGEEKGEEPPKGARSGEMTPTEGLFGELARWEPLYEIELLLRRVACRGRDELEHRMRAVREVGGIFYCANREASLGRAATDILHGYYKSALLNALRRRKPPMEMRQFFMNPNLITAARARRASTDATIRQTLKAFIATNGDWAQTAARVPYVWRRRWINALRASVWNTMASKRVRVAGRQVVVGDAVIRPSYRGDIDRRLLIAVKTEYVKIVETPEEAARYSLEDVFIPFLRGGRYPDDHFAPTESGHVIMTKSNMLKILREAHAQHLLLGFPEGAKSLLDIRVDVAPLLWRRLLQRPMAMSFTILEDKAPLRSTHFDAARILKSDRWDLKPEKCPTLPPASPRLKAHDTAGTTASPPSFFPTPESNLLDPHEILARTTLGSQVRSGTTPHNFFEIPSQDQYVVPGHARRFLEGEFVASAPHTPTAGLGDRLYTLHLRAITRHGVAGLTQLLREYFILSGVEAEVDGALQHKVHRVRRELDGETPLLTAPIYCVACYNRGHNTLEDCAEYRLKQQRRRRPLELSLPKAPAEISSAAPLPCLASGPTRLALRLALRRRSPLEKWGVHLTKTLFLTRLEDAKRAVGIQVWPLAPGGEVVQGAAAASSWPSWLISQARRHRVGSVQKDEYPNHDRGRSEASLTDATSTQVEGTEAIVRFLSLFFTEDDLQRALPQSSSTTQGAGDNLVPSLPTTSGRDHVLSARPGDSVGPILTAADPDGIFRRCEWRLKAIDGVEVGDRQAVAAAFAPHDATHELALTFEAALPAPPPPPSAARRWVGALPATLHLSLARPASVPKAAPWGLQVRGDALHLANLADLLSQHAETAGTAVTGAPHSPVVTTASHGPVVTAVPLKPAVTGAPHGPSDAFSAQALKGVEGGVREVARCFAAELNAMYRITRLNGSRVDSRKGLAAAMAAFHAQPTSVVGESPERRKRRSADAMPTTMSVVFSSVGGPGEVHDDAVCCRLQIELQRSPENDELAALAVEKPLQVNSHAVKAQTSDPARGPKASKDLKPSSPRTKGDLVGGAVESNASDSLSAVLSVSSVVGASSETAEGPGALKTTQRILTITINRRVWNAATEGRWGIRVQRGTCRLKNIQHNKLFSFTVYAYKQRQALRASNTLRDYGAVDNVDARAAEGVTFASALYFVIAVNHAEVGNYAMLRLALQPTLKGKAASLGPESITLRVRQFMLGRVTVMVRRGGPNEPSALAPIGLSLNGDLSVMGIDADSAMANGVRAATGPHCTLRRLIRPASSSPSDGTSNTPGVEWFAIPVLKTSWESFHAVLMKAVNADSTTVDVKETNRRKRYSLDEDETQRLNGGNAASRRESERSSMSASDDESGHGDDDDVLVALRKLTKVCSDIVVDLERCTMVDALQLMQTMLLQEFSNAQISRYQTFQTEEECADNHVVEAEKDFPRKQRQEKLYKDIKDAVDSLFQDMEECDKHIKWRLIYAVNAQMTMRTPKDVQDVMRPGVSEESLILQQYFLEY
ncbi:unnamed protein product [Phytomonas sp. Hart1]|nr:unnamed protein product [Phytomonas sp. Hart1]|eukprot:CCW69738.1 unnamed protein product [Phytomonas sp. isolate Hart1]